MNNIIKSDCLTPKDSRTLYTGEKYNKNQIKRAEAGGSAVLLIDPSVVYLKRVQSLLNLAQLFPKHSDETRQISEFTLLYFLFFSRGVNSLVSDREMFLFNCSENDHIMH